MENTKIKNVGQLIDYLNKLPKDAMIQKLSTKSDLLPLDGGIEVGEELSFDESQNILTICL
ncbi:hypothetical protein [Lacticaseibacillus paracasei]|uniref:Uncharacterized protein n=1 Tax=Lacticaseibacillus paracasei TaxID=1597 RepID=A0A8B3GP56_LACPA|nr:hypothetical protein [Lacticaseibacillus paracasei]RNE29992.1 hypothetical protein FAM6012_01777 [Lacticaseibacillus paracasei]